MAVPQALLDALKPWATLYGDSKLVPSVTMFVHFAGLLLGGGGAVAADRDTIAAIRGDAAAQARHLRDLRRTHRVVLAGLALTFASGLLALAGDLEALAGSVAFWIKMGLIVLLLLNGAAMVRAERGVEPGQPAGWRRLHRVAVSSLVLWFGIVLVSALMTAYA